MNISNAEAVEVLGLPKEDDNDVPVACKVGALSSRKEGFNNGRSKEFPGCGK